MTHIIKLRTTAFKRGRQLVNEVVTDVKVGDEPWRKAKSPSFTAALRWLMDQGYDAEHCAIPRKNLGTVQLIRRFAREE